MIDYADKGKNEGFQEAHPAKLCISVLRLVVRFVKHGLTQNHHL